MPTTARFARITFMAILFVPSLASSALAGQVVVTETHAYLGFGLTAAIVLSSDVLFFKYGTKSTWRHTAQAVFLGNFMSVLITGGYGYWLMIFFAEMSNNTSTISPNISLLDLIWLSRFEFLLTFILHIACILLSYLLKQGVMFAFTHKTVKRVLSKTAKPILYANIVSYGSLFFIVNVTAFFAYFYS